MSLATGAGLLALEPLVGSLMAQTKTNPQARPYPNGRDPNAPTPEERTSLDPVAIQRANQIELRKDVAKLYDMVADLKDQLDKTDSAATLSLSLLKKTQQIEKLAKQINQLAKP
jgi:hypothetical protein